jgi:fructose-1-phosphate kinase PfkB-like protein
VRIALDTSGAALVSGWRAAPEVVRVNSDEAHETNGDQPRSYRGGTTLSIISNGAGEIEVNASDFTLRIQPPSVCVRNPIGCGDAMLGGLLARIDGCEIVDALRFATALASADAESDHAGHPDLDRARALESAVQIRVIEPDVR